MGLGDLLGKVKDIAGNAGEINKLVDQLPSAVKSKVAPLISKYTAGDKDAASKAVDILEEYKSDDIVRTLISKLKK